VVVGGAVVVGGGAVVVPVLPVVPVVADVPTPATDGPATTAAESRPAPAQASKNSASGPFRLTAGV
jgi:hypothetical protein